MITTKRNQNLHCNTTNRKGHKFFLTILILIGSTISYAQKNFIDQPYIETSATADTLVVPDRIYLSITINEADSKNKKSVEEQEQMLNDILKKLNINIEKDLSLLDISSNFKKYFLKEQNILKIKMYSLLVRNAVEAGKVMSELESIGIGNVGIDRTEYSKAEELILELKSIAILKSKKSAEKLVKPLNQTVGKALHISDMNTDANALQGKAAGIQVRGMSSLYGSRANNEPIFIDFQKIKFEVQVSVKYLLDYRLFIK